MTVDIQIMLRDQLTKLLHVTIAITVSPLEAYILAHCAKEPTEEIVFNYEELWFSRTTLVLFVTQLVLAQLYYISSMIKLRRRRHIGFSVLYVIFATMLLHPLRMLVVRILIAAATQKGEPYELYYSPLSLYQGFHVTVALCCLLEIFAYITSLFEKKRKQRPSYSPLCGESAALLRLKLGAPFSEAVFGVTMWEFAACFVPSFVEGFLRSFVWIFVKAAFLYTKKSEDAKDK